MTKSYNTQNGQIFIASPIYTLEDIESIFAKSDENIEPSSCLPGRGTVKFITHKNKSFVLRHYHRGGLFGRFLKDRYLYKGISYTRPWRELGLLNKLNELNLSAPQAVACRIVRKGITYQADLIMLEIPGALPISKVIREHELDSDTWFRIGYTIKSFHQHGVYHADLNAHNILIDQQQKIWLIDFDRGAILHNKPHWQLANLRRLRRSLDKLYKIDNNYFTEESWQSLLAGYKNLL